MFEVIQNCLGFHWKFQSCTLFPLQLLEELNLLVAIQKLRELESLELEVMVVGIPVAFDQTIGCHYEARLKMNTLKLGVKAKKSLEMNAMEVSYYAAQFGIPGGFFQIVQVQSSLEEFHSTPLPKSTSTFRSIFELLRLL